MNAMPGRLDVSVITATRKRPSSLAACLHQFQSQSFGGLNCEQIVVSDGPDETARDLCRRSGARFFELDEPKGSCGAFAKDRGISEARGEYLCFWDDDNLYQRHAVTALFSAAWRVDIGVVRTNHRLRRRPGMVTIPRRWEGTFRKGDVDTMCVCVRAELARSERWGDEEIGPGTDYRWLRRLETHRPVIRYVPIVIGAHV